MLDIKGKRLEKRQKICKNLVNIYNKPKICQKIGEEKEL